MKSYVLTVIAAATAITLSTALSTTPSSASPERGTAGTTMALWRMNQPAGATVMADASGHNLNGSIGSAVRVGARVAGAAGGRAYRWPRTEPHALPVKPERLVRVADRARLDPGTRKYAVTIRFRTTARLGNLVQKGQAGAQGGYWKLEQHRGIISCLFRGSAGSSSVSSAVRLDDGRWHTVSCKRVTHRVTMTVDSGTRSQITRRTLGRTGNIANTNPLTVGGKASCNQTTVDCDYFSGDIDFIVIEANW